MTATPDPVRLPEPDPPPIPGPRGTGRERLLKVLTWSAGILVALALFWLLSRTVWVTMPLTAAFFIAIGVWPVTVAVQHRLPRRFGWLGYVAAMAIILLALGLFFFSLWYAASVIAEQWPHYAERAQSLWEQLPAWLSGVTGGRVVLATDGTDQAASGAGSLLRVVADYAVTIVRSIWDVLAMLVLIFFLVLLMLTEGRVWHAKLTEAGRAASADEWLEVISDVARRFRRYLVVRSLVGLTTGLAYCLWMWLWGVDFPIVWGLLAFLLNLVPTLGPLVAGFSAVGFAFLQKDPGSAVLVGLGILAIEQITGNYIDPLLQGRQLAISPLVALFMLLVWTWVWGVAGALLAVPITVLLMIVMARFPALLPLALLLSAGSSSEALLEHEPRA